MSATMLQPAPIQGQNQGNGRKAFTGALFINQKKTADNQPDYKGQVEIEGRKFWVSSWVNTSVGGRQYQRLTLEDFTDEDYRKSAEIEAAKAAAAKAANTQANSGWSRPANQNMAQAPIDPTDGYSPEHNIQHGSYSAPTPPADFDDD